MFLGTAVDENDSDKERSGRLLEGGDRAIGVGKRYREVRENLCGGGPASRCGGSMGRRAATEQGGADRALIPLKSGPDSPQGSIAARTFAGTDGGGNAAGDGPLEECPDGAGGQAQPPDFVGEPDADGPSAAAAAMAVAAEDPAGADGFSGAAVIESGEHAVADECADGAAVGARRELEPLDDHGPLRLAAAEPAYVAHDRDPV